MGVGRRAFSTFLCDGCGREIVAEEGNSVDGYYIEVMEVRNRENLGNDNVYACSEVCIERAIRDSLKRASLPDDDKVTATQELWLRGRSLVTNPHLPILDMRDETRVIGTAEEIRDYKPTQLTPLDPDWKQNEAPPR